MAVESPPVILYGPSRDSPGAFFSGLFILDILLDRKSENVSKPKMDDDDSPNLEPMMSVSRVSTQSLTRDYIIMKNVTVYLIQTIKYGKPFLPNSTTLQNCKKCTKHVTELARWDILSKKMAFAKGSSHSCPFSYIIPGSLPATTVLSNTDTTIKYELICKATYYDPIRKTDNTINLSQPIKIMRSILREQDKNSTRIFPPTDVTSTAVIPNVVYPRSTFPVEIRMDNVSSSKRRWRMRKLNWRLEECVTVKTPYCEDHPAKFKEVYETTKKQKRAVRNSKNSGGVGHASLNYHFELPKKQLNNNNNSIQNDQPRYVHPDDDEAQAANPESTVEYPTEASPEYSELAPAASNWSLSATASPTVAVQQSPALSTLQSQSLDHMLASSISTNLNSLSLSNPDEIIMPASSSPIQRPKGLDMYIEEIRTISVGELKSGWKSDFSGRGRIELVVEISLMDLISMGINNTISYTNSINSQTCNMGISEYFEDENSGCNCSTDIDDPHSGINVTHNLILEVVVAEELMQSTMASANHAVNRSRASQISSNSQAAIVTGNISQTRMRSSVPSPSGSSAAAASASDPLTEPRTGERRLGLTEEDFPDHRVGPDPVTGNKTDKSNHQQGIPTGVARVLRMQFKVILSERSGLGVSWNDEVPPTYPSVGPLSPPTYAQAEEDVISPSLEDLVVPLDNLDRATSNIDTTTTTTTTTTTIDR